MVIQLDNRVVSLGDDTLYIVGPSQELKEIKPIGIVKNERRSLFGC